MTTQTAHRGKRQAQRAPDVPTVAPGASTGLVGMTEAALDDNSILYMRAVYLAERAYRRRLNGWTPTPPVSRRLRVWATEATRRADDRREEERKARLAKLLGSVQ